MSETPNGRINKMMQDAIDNNIPAHQRPLLVMGLLKQFGTELAAMTARAELAEKNAQWYKDEYEGWRAVYARDCDPKYGVKLAELTGRAELAERQVAVLCGFLSSLNVYLDGAPGKIEGWDAWSREQAAKEGGKG